jgi:hypothetical protein
MITGNPPPYTTQYTQYTTQYTQQRTSTYWSKPAYTTVYRTDRPPPPRSTTYIATTEVYTTFYQPTTVITYYQPLPTPQSHSTYHRSENTYTTIYAPATTYYVPVYVEPPTTSTSTEYVYQTYVAPTVTAASASKQNSLLHFKHLPDLYSSCSGNRWSAQSMAGRLPSADHILREQFQFQ